MLWTPCPLATRYRHQAVPSTGRPRPAMALYLHNAPSRYRHPMPDQRCPSLATTPDIAECRVVHKTLPSGPEWHARAAHYRIGKPRVRERDASLAFPESDAKIVLIQPLAGPAVIPGRPGHRNSPSGKEVPHADCNQP